MFTPFVLVLGVTWVIRQGWPGGSVFIILSLSFELFVGWALLLGLSDILVNDEGIRRVAYGICWQEMRWSDIARVCITRSRNPQVGQLTRSYVLISETNLGNCLTRRITFQERNEGMSDLIVKMETCLALHKILVTNIS